MWPNNLCLKYDFDKLFDWNAMVKQESNNATLSKYRFIEDQVIKTKVKGNQTQESCSKTSESKS